MCVKLHETTLLDQSIAHVLEDEVEISGIATISIKYSASNPGWLWLCATGPGIRLISDDSGCYDSCMVKSSNSAGLKLRLKVHKGEIAKCVNARSSLRQNIQISLTISSSSFTVLSNIHRDIN